MDNEKAYVSKEITNELKSLAIKQCLISLYNPTSYGISERINRYIVNILKIYKYENVRKIKDLIEKRINEIANTTSGFSLKEIKLK